MLYVVRFSFLLISICIRSMSWAATVVQVIKSSGHDVTIECATDKTPQDGVYMYKQDEASKQQELFYFYKENHLDFKTVNKSKVSVSGALPNLSVTLLHVTAEDIGVYWCEFNLEEKNTVGKLTWLWIEKDCTEDVFPLWKIVLLLCVVMLLCINGICCMSMKMKGCWGNKKYTPSNPPSESVYEEMKRSNLNGQPSVRTFINPDYQSSKQLR
ncbi:uncharacterized protein LOC143706763 [Siphateles boraxobius]|uniref:uncharacterized protein LOC143706763 n=1 Tax=Siphateles boraxobius TaxID=180520 RepID=UPI0040646ACB